MLADAAASLSLPLDSLRTALGDRYRVERELGRGGMAIVLLAEDLQYGRKVAIKVLRPELTSGIGAARFLREITIASRLSHPHLLPVLDSRESAGCLFYVMPYIEGDTLRGLMDRQKQLPIGDVVRIAGEVAGALAYAHRQGFVHRDIKPENILIQDGRAIVADFGIARALTASTEGPKTSSGIVLGTPTYMSPEQGYANPQVDERTDIYSLGCVLYEMLVGEPPFTGPNSQAVLARHASERVPSLRIIRPAITEEMEAVVHRALAKVPADRFQTVEELATALAESAVPKRQSVLRWISKHRVAVAATAAALAAGAVTTQWLSRTPLNQNDWLLVADFDGPTDDVGLAGTVRDLTTQALKQSRFVQVLERRQLNEVMRRASVPETTHVDAERARELAQRSSVRAVMRGSLRRINATTIELVLHVVRADDGAMLASAVGTATEQSMSDSVQTLVRTIRSKLGEKRGAITANRPLRDVTTFSFEAFRNYSAALDVINLRNDFVGANAFLRRALALDSGFAPAWALLGANYLSLRQLDSARASYAKALALPGRMSAAELYRLRGDAAYAFDHDLRGTVRWYDLYLAELPTSRSGLANRAVYRSALGEWAEAIRDLRAAALLSPFGAALNQPALFNLADALVVVGNRAEARLVRDSLVGPPAAYVDLILGEAEGRWAAVETTATRAVAEPKTTGFYRTHAVTSLGGAMAAQGAAIAADGILKSAADSATGSTARWFERARLLLALGNGAPVRARTDIVPHDTTPAAQMLRALWSAVAGDTTPARRTLDTYAPGGHPSARLAATFGQAPLLIDGWIAAHRGDWRSIVTRLAPIASAGEMDPTIFDRPDSYHLRWLVARAYERLDMADSAIAYYDLLLQPTLVPPGHYPLRGLTYPSALFHLAQLHARQGATAAATHDLDALLSALGKTDTSTTRLLVDARALRNRLTRGPAN